MKEINAYFPEERSNWLELIDIVQNKLKLDVYPGGYSAMIGWYHQHEGRFRYILEYLYGKDVSKIPKELLKQEKWERDFYLMDCNYFPKDLEMKKIKSFNYSIKIPNVERAILEMADGIGVSTSMERVYEYYSDLGGCLDSINYQELLENCSSERLRRVGLFLAEESESSYYPKLNLKKIPLDLDKNRDYSFNEDFSNHILNYNMQTPGNLIIEICKYLPNHLKEHYQENNMPIVAF